MDPKRRASSSHNQMGSVISPSPSGVTSVWVGSRPSKDPPRPPPPPKVNSNSTLSDHGTDGHLTTRRVSTGAGQGEYVVVSVRNSISEPASPFSRRNSTVITPMSTTFSGNGRPISSSDQTSASGGSHPFPSTSSLGGPQQQTSSALQATSTGSTTNSCARDWNDLCNSSNIPATKSSVTGDILSNSQNILGNNSSNSASGSLLNNNPLNSSNCLMNSLLYNAGNFVPPVTPSMNMFPLTSPGLSSLLFPQSCGLSADLLASSLNQTLNLSQMPNLKQPQILPQTNSLLGLTQSPYLPIPSAGQSQILPQTSSLLGFPQIPLLPMPTTPLDMLSSTLSTNQALLPSNLQFPTLFPTQSLPLTTTPGNLSGTETSAAPADQNLTHSKSPPPLLNQKPSEAFHAKRASLKAKEATTREGKPPKRLSWSSPAVDQEDEQTTSGVESLTPSRRSSSTSLPDLSVCEVDYPTDEDYLPAVTVEPCYDPPYDPQSCMRCGKRVYTMDKQVGPVRRVLYHKPCFTCVACGTVLTLNNYQLNDDDKGDLNVYCASHKPWVRHSPLDSEALLMQQAVLTLPRPQICA